MPLPVLMLALALQSAPAEPVIVVGNRWAPFISPMGEPFRSRAEGDDTLANWFAAADRGRDGALTLAELQADAGRFFVKLDTDGDGEVHPEEIIAYEWEIVPEVQVNSKRRRARGEAAPAAKVKRSARSAADDPDALQGAARYALLNMPQPVAAADANFDRAITLDEFLAAAATRFALLDRAGDRRLSLPDLRALLPAPTDKARRRASKGARDARIAVPVPLHD